MIFTAPELPIGRVSEPDRAATRLPWRAVKRFVCPVPRSRRRLDRRFTTLDTLSAHHSANLDRLLDRDTTLPRRGWDLGGNPDGTLRSFGVHQPEAGETLLGLRR
jgi:hypothetical protein